MKQFVTFLFGTFLGFSGNAQVCPPIPQPKKERIEENDPDPQPDGKIVPQDVPYFDPNNISPEDKNRKNTVHLGYGMNFIVGINNSLNGSGRSTGFSWFNDHPGHVFDLSGSLGETKKWRLGVSFGFQKIGHFSASRTYLPADYLTNTSQQSGLFPLGLTLKGKASSYSLLLYTEYEAVRFWRNFSFIVRAETGTTLYRTNMSLNYTDTCGCNKVPLSDWESSASFNVGLGLGLKWEYRFIGIKALAIYQGQTKVSFKARDQYAGYSPEFNAANYNFQGAPGSALFSINKNNSDKINYSPFYLQFMLYFNIK